MGSIQCKNFGDCNRENNISDLSNQPIQNQYTVNQYLETKILQLQNDLDKLNTHIKNQQQQFKQYQEQYRVQKQLVTLKHNQSDTPTIQQQESSQIMNEPSNLYYSAPIRLSKKKKEIYLDNIHQRNKNLKENIQKSKLRIQKITHEMNHIQEFCREHKINEILKFGYNLRWRDLENGQLKSNIIKLLQNKNMKFEQAEQNRILNIFHIKVTIESFLEEFEKNFQQKIKNVNQICDFNSDLAIIFVLFDMDDSSIHQSLKSNIKNKLVKISESIQNKNLMICLLKNKNGLSFCKDSYKIFLEMLITEKNG